MSSVEERQLELGFYWPCKYTPFPNLDKSFESYLSYRNPNIPCVHEWYKETEFLICSVCLEIDAFETDSRKQKNDKPMGCGKIWNRKHDRNRWTNYTMMRLRGWEVDRYDTQLWFDIVSHVPETFQWHQVFKVFQKRIGCTDLWVSFGWYVDVPIIINPIIFQFTQKFTNTFKGLYRFNYLYILYKFTQMFKPGFEHLIPLKLTQITLAKTDKEWEQVCIANQLIYKTSCVHSVTFNKDKIIKIMIQSNINQHGILI